MKKLFIIVMAIMSMAFYCNVYAAPIHVTFEHDGINTDGYYFEYYPQVDPSIIGRRVVNDNTVRDIELEDESRFTPCVPYVFVGKAFKEDPYVESGPASVVYTNTPEGGCPIPPTPQNIGDYVAPGSPSEVQLIQIWK